MYYNDDESDYYRRWETWADWNDCGSSWCNDPDCHYHRFPNTYDSELENCDSEEYYENLEPSDYEEDMELNEAEYNEYLGDKYGYEPGCLECGEDGSSVHNCVCACSPLYPDLRPNDLPRSECLCNGLKYRIVGHVICKCNSPDLYTLLERLRELELTDNFELVLRDWSDDPAICDSHLKEIPF